MKQNHSGDSFENAFDMNDKRLSQNPFFLKAYDRYCNIFTGLYSAEGEKKITLLKDLDDAIIDLLTVTISFFTNPGPV